MLVVNLLPHQVLETYLRRGSTTVIFANQDNHTAAQNQFHGKHKQLLVEFPARQQRQLCRQLEIQHILELLRPQRTIARSFPGVLWKKTNWLLTNSSNIQLLDPKWGSYYDILAEINSKKLSGTKTLVNV